MLKKHGLGAMLLLIPGNFKTARSRATFMKLIVPLMKNTGKNCAFFSTNVKLIKLLSSVMLQSQMKNYFGNLLKVSDLRLR